MKAGQSKSGFFWQVVTWLASERRAYQTKKFDYEAEIDMPVEYWEQQFDSYIQRFRVFPTDSPQYAQAALKLAATAIAHAEHVLERGVPIPKPGVSSGTIEEWWSREGNPRITQD
jgi:hypothetical protein